MQSRHCAGVGGWRSPRRLGKPLPKAAPNRTPQPPTCPPPTTPASLRLCPGAVWKGSSEPSEAPRLGIWGRDGARPRLSLEFAASLAPGKFLKSSQQRLPRSPLQGEETATSAPV